MDALYLVAAALLIVLLHNILYAHVWDHGLTAAISFSEEPVTEGEQSYATEVILNNKLLPLPVLRVKFQIDRNLVFQDMDNTSVSDKSYRHDIFSVMFFQKITRRLPFTCRRRGYYTIDQLDLLTYGLFLTGHLVKLLPVDTRLYVYPAPADPAQLSIPLSRLMGEILSLTYSYEDPFEFRSIREYQPFDTMNAVNWKATARTGQLRTNVRGYTSSQEVYLLLNLESETIWEYDELRETSIRIAGSLGRQLISRGIPTGLFSNGLDAITNEPACLFPGCTPLHSTALMETLSRIKAGKQIPSFCSLLAHLAEMPDKTADNRIYVIISTSQRAGNEEALAKLFKGSAPRSAASITQAFANAFFLCPLYPDMDFRPPRLPGMNAYRWEVPYDQK